MMTNEENNYINVELHICNVLGYIQLLLCLNQTLSYYIYINSNVQKLRVSKILF